MMEVKVIYLSIFLHGNHLLSSPQMPGSLLKFLIQKHLRLSLCNFAEQSKLDEKNHADPKQNTRKCGTE